MSEKTGSHLEPFEFVQPVDPANIPINRCSVSREAATQRILIMRLGAHGDIIMATPLLAALRSVWPNCHITWIVERKETQAIDANPYIDELLLWNSSLVKRPLRRLNIVGWLAMILRLRRELSSRSFDAFISYQPEEWTMVARACGAAKKIGVFDTFRQFNRNAPTSPNSKFYTDAFAYRDLPAHRTDQFLLPLKALGLTTDVPRKMSVGYTYEDRIAVDAFLASKGIISDKPYAVLAPMTTWPSRCWEGDRYVQLARRLQVDMPIVMIASASERAAVERIADHISAKVALAAGNLSFRQMVALIDGAEVLVSGDTGPMHVAAAVDTPYVALFGSTPLDERAPLAGTGAAIAHPVPCGPCDQKECRNIIDPMLCMKLITVDEVYGKVESQVDLLKAITR